MKFTKVRKVKDPDVAHAGDAGIDFFVPELDYLFFNDFWNINDHHRIFLSGDKVEGIKIIIPPHNRILIPSGIHVKLKPGIALIAMNKSGVATKLGLDVMAQVVDEHYQGEVHISLVNTSTTPVHIMSGDKIIQFVRFKINQDPLEEVDSLETLYDEVSSRGSGGFGSTNKK